MGRGQLWFLVLLGTALARAQPAPPTLAQHYRPGIDVATYWVSEKYDGVRALWTGTELQSRQGLPIRAPAWFTAGWPATPLDGELWAGRGRFDAAQSAVATWCSTCRATRAASMNACRHCAVPRPRWASPGCRPCRSGAWRATQR
jgi:ATP-dependent DNA ligase